MKAFHGSSEIKDKYVARLKAHHAADEIMQGIGWENGKGCAVGCTLNNHDHSAYPSELGLPVWLARLQDRIFEGLPPKDAKDFAVAFLDSIPVGADVANVRWKLASLRHRRDRERFIGRKESYIPELIAALDQAISYCESEEKTELARLAAFSAAKLAAWAADSASRSAYSAYSAESVAESAESVAESARSAAESAAWSAESAAWAAESAAGSAWLAAESALSAAWSADSASRSAFLAAKSDHYIWEAENLLRLLSEAPIVA